MKVVITTTRFVVLDTLFKHGGWVDAATLTKACGFEDPTSAFGIAKGLAELGLVETMKRRIDNRLSRVKLLTHWRISEAGVRLLDEFNAGRRVFSTASTAGPPPEPEPVMEPAPTPTPAPEHDPEISATIRELKAEIFRLRLQVAKYADITVDVPNVGEVRMTKDEVHTLLQHLLELSREGQ